MAEQILHIDLDAFFASAEQALNPSLMGKPVIVGGRPDGRGVVAAASYPARAYGIKAGMPLSRAHHLCPHAIFLEGRFAHYKAASNRFMSILVDFSPFIEPAGIDEAFLDVTGFESLYGPAHLTAQRIKERIHRELRLTASVGLSTCKLVSKVASDLDKPDGLVEVLPGEEANFLHPLPLGRLPGVGPRTERTLKGIGINTIGEMAALPQPYLRHLFGKNGESLWHWARGEDDSPVELPGEAKSISRSTTFSEDTLDRSFLLGMLRYLSEKVGAELRKMGRQAQVVSLKLRYNDFETLTRQRHLLHTTNADQVIFETGKELMDGLLASRLKLVRLIGIGVADLVSGKQLRLLPSPLDKLERLNRAVDWLRRRYGFTVVQTGRTLALHRDLDIDDGDYILRTPCLAQ